VSLLFIFDMDEVLYGYDWHSRMRGLSGITGIPFAELRERWWNADGEFAAEAGAFRSGAEYMSAFEVAMGAPVDTAEFVRVRAEAMTAWPESIAAVRRASELGQITLLTNNGALVGEHLARMAPDIAELFGDHLLTSSHYGARKPDPEVYSRVLAAYGTAASDAFFADDLPENVEAASELGIAAHLFTSPAGLRAAIEAFAAARA
jgi:HAD superfamily hydrolase (TIGR01509 family)